MTSAGLGKLVWPGAILAGLALLGFVALTWPEPTTRVVRLPYGESLPKTPHLAVPAVRSSRVAVTAEASPTVESAPAAAPAATEEKEAERVLAAVEPAPSAYGPAPVPSALERSPGYVRESPEQLGAEPLPGTELTPEPPVAAG